MATMMDSLQTRLRPWRERQVDVVGVDGYRLPESAPRTVLMDVPSDRHTPLTVERLA